MHAASLLVTTSPSLVTPIPATISSNNNLPLHAASLLTTTTSSIDTPIPARSSNFISAITSTSDIVSHPNKPPSIDSCITSTDSQSPSCLYTNTFPPYDISAPYVCPPKSLPVNGFSSNNSSLINNPALLSLSHSSINSNPLDIITPAINSASNTLIPSTIPSQLFSNAPTNYINNYSTNSGLDTKVPHQGMTTSAIDPVVCASSFTDSTTPQLDYLNSMPFSLPFSATVPLLDKSVSTESPTDVYTSLSNNKYPSPNSFNTASEEINVIDSNMYSIPPPVAFRSLALVAPPTHEPKTLSTIHAPKTPTHTQSIPNYTTSNPQPNILTKSVSDNKAKGQLDTEPVNSMHKRNIFTTNAACAAAIVAIKHGSTEMEVMSIGNEAAKNARHSFSQRVANKNNSKTKIKDNIVKINGTVQNSALSSDSQQKITVSGNGSSDTLLNTDKKNTKFMRGTSSAPGRSLAGELPEHFKNKVLVISPVSKKLNQIQINEEINKIAGKNIKFQFEPILLNKKCQDTRTIAIELKTEDYRLLFNRSIWNSNMKISEFKGERFWRRNNLGLTKVERKFSVRDSWYP